MSKVADDLLYTREHMWVLVEDNIATVGLTDHAQFELGELTGIELPAVGAEVEQGGEAGAVESVKTTAALSMPVSGKVLEVNEDLEDDPAPINEDPYVDGWICKIALSDPEEVEVLLSAEDYEDFLAEE